MKFIKNNKLLCSGLILSFLPFFLNLIIGIPINYFTGCNYNPELGGTCMYNGIDFTQTLNLLFALMWVNVATFFPGTILVAIGAYLKIKAK
jgi:hypothetical protein